MLLSRAFSRDSPRLCTRGRLNYYATARSTPGNENGDGLNAVISHWTKELGDTVEVSGTQSKGSLQGRNVAVKDNIASAELATTAASKILQGYKSPFEATVVKLLRRHGASVTQTTNLDEFGMGSHSQASHFGPVKSLYSRDGVALSPGGSSGGSAVAVTLGDAWAALGTDTGGSVRLPAAYTGTVGFKPSYGLLSRWGVIQYANSLDTVGILAQKVQRVKEVFSALNAHDKNDPTSLPPRLRRRLTSTPPKTQALRIGIPIDYNIRELTPLVRKTWLHTLHTLQSHGHTLHAITLPHTSHALSAYYVLAPAEASSNLAKYDGIRYGTRSSSGADAQPSAKLPLYARTRGEGLGEEVRRRVLLGAYTLSSEAKENYFLQAQKVRRLVQGDFDRVFARGNGLLDCSDGEQNGIGDGEGENKVDVVITPTAPTLPPTVEDVRRLSPVEGYMNDVFTVPASLAGLPAVSVPVGLDAEARKGMDGKDVQSVGLQILGQFGDDETVLSVADMIEQLQP